MTDCRWERAKAAGADLAKQHWQVKRCKCGLCGDVRAVFIDGDIPKGGRLVHQERVTALLWSPGSSA